MVAVGTPCEFVMIDVDNTSPLVRVAVTTPSELVKAGIALALAVTLSQVTCVLGSCSPNVARKDVQFRELFTPPDSTFTDWPTFSRHGTDILFICKRYSQNILIQSHTMKSFQ